MAIADRARGLYVRSPWWLKRLTSPLLAALPPRLRYGGSYWQLRQEIARSERDPDFVLAYQRRHLRRLIRTAIEGTRYYPPILREAFGQLPHPDSFEPEMLRRLPVLGKETLRHEPEALLAAPLDEVDVVSTSGSSGEPLKFYLDRNRSPREWAFMNHIWSRIGYRVRDRRAVLRGIHIRHADEKPWEFDPALGELRLSPFHLTDESMSLYLDLICRFQVSYIHGYPSAISILAAHARKNAWQPPASLRGVLPISETLFRHQRRLIESAFGSVSLMPVYGLSEKVAIAGEIPGQPEVYEFEPLYGLSELVDGDGLPIATPGTSGRIISTGFISTVMPLLRYDTGDRGILVAPAEHANGHRLRVRGIRSRWSQEFLVAQSGALISIAAINIHSPAYAAVIAFQFYQDQPGAAVVKAIPRPGYGREDIEPFVREVQDKVGSSLSLELELTDHLTSNRRGKRPFIDQRLPVEALGQAEASDSCRP